MSKPKKWLITFIVGAIMATSLAVNVEAATLEVGIPGSSYPYTSIQTAINDAVNDDEVLVHDGTYMENIRFNGKAITVQSENGAAATIIEGNGSGTLVGVGTKTTGAAVLNGVTITNRRTGLAAGSEALITNCIIKNNTYISSTKGAGGGGAGIYCGMGASATITNCTISNNMSGYGSKGGGISCWYSTATFINCTISSNISEDKGGGIYCEEASPMFTNCTISNNTGYTGGGIYCNGGSSLTTIKNSTISNNLANRGGGIYCYWFKSSPTITNCTLTGNTANGSGGGIYCSSSSPTITNCTISNNSAQNGGGGITIYNAILPNPQKIVVVNSILWGDTTRGSPNEINIDTYGSSIIDITYSDIQGGFTGIGNIDIDPQFIGTGNYHLTASSPCINAGDNNALGLILTDRDGQPRIIYGTVDMGAYEYTEEPRDYDATGVWRYSLTNEWIGSVCYWHRDMAGTFVITQTGDSVEGVDNYNGTMYTGTVSGTNYTVSGLYPDLGGISTVTIYFTLTSNISASGHMTVHWTDGTYNCSGGADISFTFIKICSYSLSSTSKTFPSSGETGSVSVSTSNSCPWSATSNASWITITSGRSGNGNGTVNYSVSSNSSKSQRTGTMTIAGQTYTITQNGRLITVTTGDIDGSGKDEVIIDFVEPPGIWIRLNNSTWTQLHTLSTETMTIGDIDGNGKDDIVIDFGLDYGIWVRMNNNGWVNLHSVSPKTMTTGDIDGNGQDDVIIDFGLGYGIWVRMNNSAWAQLHHLSPMTITTCDMDGSGSNDVIINFGDPYGIWCRMNNSTWSALPPP